MGENKIITSYPWVFWVRIEKRKWFKNFWKSRGSNCLDIQIYNIHISIGMPWHKNVLKYASEDNINGFESLKTANKSFTKWYCLHIGKYKN